jgi:hypothetical protein
MILIPSLNINLPLKDYTGRKHLASDIDAFNCYNPFPIAWLNELNEMRLLRHIRSDLK